MKRIAALALALMLALGLGTEALAEEPGTAVALEPAEVFQEATEALLGAKYEMLCLAVTAELGEGRVFGFLTRVTAVAPGAEPHLAIVAAYVDGERTTHLMEVLPYPFVDENGDPAPATAEVLFNNVMLPVAALPEGTAGASLQQAQRVADLWTLCAAYDFTRMDAEAVREAEAEALAMMTEEERAAYAENAPAIRSEAARLLDPAETADGVYADAGVAELLAVLRAEEAVRASMAAYLAAAETPAE